MLSSLIDELLAMVPGEVSQFLCKREDVMGGMLSPEIPPELDLLLEVNIEKEILAELDLLGEA